MKSSDLGIDPKTGCHDRNLTRVEERFLGILWVDHVGEEKKITADALAIIFRFLRRGYEVPGPEMLVELIASYKRTDRDTLDNWKRSVRLLHNHLLELHDHIPILSKAGPKGGYWIAETREEADAFYAAFRKRGLTGLRKATRGKKAEMVDAMTQLSFEFDDLIDKGPYTGRIKRRVETPTPIEVVDAFLEKMLQDPEKYADGFRKIGKKYGSVLLPRDQVAAMQVKARELQEILAGLTRS